MINKYLAIHIEPWLSDFACSHPSLKIGFSDAPATIRVDTNQSPGNPAEKYSARPLRQTIPFGSQLPIPNGRR